MGRLDFTRRVGVHWPAKKELVSVLNRTGILVIMTINIYIQGYEGKCSSLGATGSRGIVTRVGILGRGRGESSDDEGDDENEEGAEQFELSDGCDCIDKEEEEVVIDDI